MCRECFLQAMQPYVEVNRKEGFDNLNEHSYIVRFLPFGERLESLLRALVFFSYPKEIIELYIEEYKSICLKVRQWHALLSLEDELAVADGIKREKIRIARLPSLLSIQYWTNQGILKDMMAKRGLTQDDIDEVMSRRRIGAKSKPLNKNRKHRQWEMDRANK